MPGAYGRTSTLALANVTLPYIRQLAQTPVGKLIREAPGLSKGIQAFAGNLTCKAVAEALRLSYTPLESVVAR